MSIQVYACTGCGRNYFESSERCAHCGEGLEGKNVSGLGRIYSYSEVHLGPEGMETPYLLALVELEGGGRVLGRLQAMKPAGTVVDEVVRFDGLSEAGPLFRLENGSERSNG